MKYCNIQNGKCVECGRTLRFFDPTKEYVAACKSVATVVQPRLIGVQLRNKIEAYKLSVTRGWKRSQGEVDKQLNICSTCPLFTGNRCSLNSCIDRFTESLVLKTGRCFDNPPKWGDNEVQSMPG